MGFNTPEEKQIEEFLARQLPWLRKILQGDPLSWEEMSTLQQPDGFEILGQSEDEYLKLLQRCPAKLREYRKRQEKISVLRLPSVPAGRPRKDALAQEALELERGGSEPTEIACILNRKYPNLEDRKGNKCPITADAVRKLLDSRRSGPTAAKT